MSEPNALKCTGTEVFVNGVVLTVPSLSVKQFLGFYDVLDAQDPENPTKEQVIKRYEDLVPAVGAAVRRNYPEISDEYLREHLNLASFRRCIVAIQNVPNLPPLQKPAAV